MRRPTPSLRTVTRATSRKSTCERCVSLPAGKRLAPSALAPTRSITDFNFLSPHRTSPLRSSSLRTSPSLRLHFYDSSRHAVFVLLSHLAFDPHSPLLVRQLYTSRPPLATIPILPTPLSVLSDMHLCVCVDASSGGSSKRMHFDRFATLRPSSEPGHTPTIASSQTTAYTLPSTWTSFSPSCSRQQQPSPRLRSTTCLETSRETAASALACQPCQTCVPPFPSPALPSRPTLLLGSLLYGAFH